MKDIQSNPMDLAAVKGFGAISSVQRPDLVTLITESIRQRVLDGRYIAGQVLPAEAELAKAFAVSRNVMREALRQLRVLGLVEVTQGRPPRIRDVSPEASINALSTLLSRCEGTLEQLMETRIPLEVQVVRLLARAKRTPDLSGVLEANQRVNGCTDYRKRNTADLDFHLRLAEATGNQLLATVTKTVTGLTFDLRDKALQMADFPDWPFGEPYPQKICNDHDQVIEAIRGHDEEAAAQVMSKHLQGLVGVFRRLEEACRKNSEGNSSRRPGTLDVGANG